METPLTETFPKATAKRFWVEEAKYDDRSDVLPAGKRKLYAMRPQVCFSPESLEIIAFVGAERLATPTVKLVEIRLADHKLATDDVLDARGQIDLLGKNVRSVQVAESFFVVLENVGKADLKVTALLHGAVTDGHDAISATQSHMLALEPCGDEKLVRRFVIPAGSSFVPVTWRSLWVFRPTEIWIRSDSRGDVRLEDAKVGNRSQFINSSSLPVEAFARGVKMAFDTLAVAQDLSFYFCNLGKEDRWVEIEAAGFAADEGILETEDLEHDIREYPVGFLETIPAGKTVKIKKLPQVDFTGELLTIAFPEDFWVHDLKVNGKSQFVTATRLPASAFAPGQRSIRLSMDECRVGVEIELVIENASDEDRRLQATILGTGKTRMYDWSSAGDRGQEIPSEVRQQALQQLQDLPLFRTLCRRIWQERLDGRT